MYTDPFQEKRLVPKLSTTQTFALFRAKILNNTTDLAIGAIPSWVSFSTYCHGLGSEQILGVASKVGVAAE
jgi:hypothetical protein